MGQIAQDFDLAEAAVREWIEQAERGKFAALTRDLVARGRAAGMLQIIILATQRPSHQVTDPSMRDLFDSLVEPFLDPRRSDVAVVGIGGETETVSCLTAANDHGQNE